MSPNSPIGRSPAGRTLVLRSRGAARALASPARVEILEKLQAIGPAGAKALAAALERTPHSLYYHLHRLVAVGALRESLRRGGRRGEAVYSLAAERIALPGAPSSPPRRAAAAAAAGALLRRAARNFARSLPRDAASARATRAAGSRQARLDAEALEEVASLLARIDSLLAAANGRGAGDAYLFTFALAPLAARPSRRRSR